MNTKYLQVYPNLWPIFSTKNYIEGKDGWWHPITRIKRVKRNKIIIDNRTQIY